MSAAEVSDRGILPKSMLLKKYSHCPLKKRFLFKDETSGDAKGKNTQPIVVTN